MAGPGRIGQPAASWGARTMAAADGHCLLRSPTASAFAGLHGRAPPQCGLGLLTPRFMEFEAEEEIQIQKLQWVKVAQGASAAAPPKPGTQGSPALEGGRQPGTAPTFPRELAAEGSGA